MDTQFFIVPTPIGNLNDITLRAMDVLKSVDYIACEDTRVTKVLAEKYGLSAKLFDCHKFNEKERSEKIISLIKDGNKIALVSDAGTPAISDPGSVVVKELLKNDIKITSLPGACAVSTFLSRVPRNTEEYTFIGFIPRNKKQQEEILTKYRFSNCVFYESANRLLETLENIQAIYGEDKLVAVGRELTKVFEEVKILSVKDMIKYYIKNPLKGEIVSMVFAQEECKTSDIEVLEKIKLLKDDGFSQKDISKIISKLYGVNKNKVYKLALAE